MVATNVSASGQSQWNAPQAYAIAGMCLVLGIVFGYMGRGSAAPMRVPPQEMAQHSPQAAPRMRVTPAQLKHIADKQAEPLLEELKNKPAAYDTLVKLAKTYYDAHQPDNAIKYMVEALKAKPDDVDTRVHLGIVYFYTGRQERHSLNFNAHWHTTPGTQTPYLILASSVGGRIMMAPVQ